MYPRNNHLIIQPIKEGMIQTEGNEYLVLKAPACAIEELVHYKPGDIVIVEDHLVIKVLVGGKETYFVKEENILAVICGPKKSD